MKLIVGLGNPGKQYEKTRHNLGFMVVDQFLKDFITAKTINFDTSAKFKSEVASIEWQPKHGILEKVILVKPLTYMNNSGMAVSLISKYHKIAISDIWIVHDDLDLTLGSMKIRFGGAAAGHHGVESIIEFLDNDKFWRFRMGIGIHKSQDRDVEDYVLGKFSAHEQGNVKELIHKGSEAIQLALEESLERAMNRFNTK